MKRQSAYKIKSRQKLQENKLKRRKYTFPTNFLTALVLLIFAIYLVIDFKNEINDDLTGMQSLMPSYLVEKFKLKKVVVSGNNHLNKDDILQLANINYGDNLWQYDLNKMAMQLKSNGWIREVSIKRVLPFMLKLNIVERVPKAIWWNEENFYKIDSDGEVIEKLAENEEKEGYIVLFGDEAKNKYNNIHDLIFSKNIARNIVSLVYVGNRRWDLYFADNLVVKLPEQDYEAALNVLAKILQTESISAKVSMIDLRFIPDKIFIKQKILDN